MTDQSPYEEVSIEVPAQVMKHPLGFVIDAGVSLIKLVYRSKDDYKNGKPLKISNQGILHLKTFNIDVLLFEFLRFIEDHVDIAVKKEHEGVLWWQMAATTLNFKPAIEKKFNIKTKMMGETYEIVEFIIDNFQHLNLRMHPPSLNSLRDAAKIEESLLFNVCEIERLLTLHLSNEPSSFHQHTSSNPSSHTYLDELVATEDYEAWAEKHLKHTGDIKASSLFFMASSCGVLYKINEEREVSFLDVISTCGNTCIAVCEETLGEKDFGKVIKLAEKGDIRKVSLFAEEVKSEEGCYRAKCDFVIFNLGKLASNNLKGKDQYVSYTREDLAAGLLDCLLHMLANFLVLQALLHSVHTIYAHGSLFQSAYIRQVFEKYVLKDSLQAYVAKGKPLKIHFFENSCFMDSLNVWMKNVEEEKKRIINMESKI